MNLAQALLNELKLQVCNMKKEVERREEIIAYFEDFFVEDLKSDENEDSIHKKYQLYNSINKPLYEKLNNDPKVIIKSKYSWGQ